MIASCIDHTNLKPIATPRDIDQLCHEAIENKFRAVCVNLENAERAVENLKDSRIKTAVVIDFPLGASGLNVKLSAVRFARNNHVDEIDVVWNLGRFKNLEYWHVLRELHRIVDTADGMTVKVIVEVPYLIDNELKMAFEIVADSGAQYIKTSTGFIEGQQYVAVCLWQKCRTLSRSDLKIKASGGIRSYADSVRFLEAGADIIGTSSGIKIIEEEKNHG